MATAKSITEWKAEITDNANRQKRNVTAFYRKFPTIAEMVADFTEANEDTMNTVWFSPYYGGSLTYNYSRLDSFKDEGLCDYLLMLEQFFGIEFKMTERPECMVKRFDASITWDGGNLAISVDANIKSDAAGCKRVQIGIKTDVIETPIYRLDCEGDSPAAESPEETSHD